MINFDDEELIVDGKNYEDHITQNVKVREIMKGENGTFYRCGNCVIHVSNDVDLSSGNIPVYEYVFGERGGETSEVYSDTRRIMEYINSGDENLKGITIINGSLYTHSGDYISQYNFGQATSFHRTTQAIIENISNQVEESTGVKPEFDVIPAGWSAGVMASVKEAAYSNSKAAIMIDSQRQQASRGGEYQLNVDERSMLRENGTTIYAVEGSKNAKVEAHFEEFYVKEGIDIVVVHPSKNDGSEIQHWEAQDWTYKSGLNEVVAGRKDNLNTVYDKDGNAYNVDFTKAVASVDENGNTFVEYIPITEEEAFSTVKRQSQFTHTNYSSITKEDAEKLATKEDGTIDEEKYQEAFDKYVKTRDGQIVSVSYAFADEYTTAIKNAILKTNILSESGVSIPTDGSQTFTAANKAFENYSVMSKSFLGSLDIATQNIMLIAESMNKLDNNLAEEAGSIDTYLSVLNGLDLDVYKKFYNTPPDLGLFFDDAQDIKISRAKLIEASTTGNALISAIMQDINDSSDVQKELMNFVESSKENLTGEAWDTVRTKMDEYREVCQEKQEYAENLITSMISAYSKLLEYMKYDELDTSKIPETKTLLDSLKTQLEALQNTLAITPLKIIVWDGFDANGNAMSHEEDNPLIKQLEDAIELCNEIITETSNYLEQLEGLKDVDANSANQIQDAEQNKPQIEEENVADIAEPSVNKTNDLDVKDISGAVNNAINGALAGMGLPNPNEKPKTKIDEIADNMVNNIKQNRENMKEEEKSKDTKDVSNNSSGGGGSYSPPSETETKSPQENSNYNDFPDYNDVVTNDNQLVYNVNNECKLIIKHEGENVNGFEFYYDFQNKSNADAMYSQVLEKYQDIEGFDKILQSDRYLKVVFNEDYYGNQSLSSFKEVYSNYYNQV